MLRSPNGDYFEMEILGYQSPEAMKVPLLEGEDDYQNWLMVSISAKKGDLSWTAMDPALLSWELGNLIEYAKKVIAGDANAECEPFVELNLGFSCGQATPGAISDEDVFEIRVALGMELGPFPRGSYKTPGNLEVIRFRVMREELLAFVEELERYLKQFPPA